LGVSGVLKGVEHFFEGNHLLTLLVHCLPNHPVGSLPQLL
jgi:hypothetical protein